MPKSLLILLCLCVAALQSVIWHAAEVRNAAAQQLAGVARSVQGKVTLGEGKLVDGKSRYVVRYEFPLAGGQGTGEEYLSMRQAVVPKAGEEITVFYNPSDPTQNTLTDPRVLMNRTATLKMLVLGFGAFTYAFIYVIWKGQSQTISDQVSPPGQ